nr:hypothetical protein [Bacillus marinisedimentorum]
MTADRRRRRRPAGGGGLCLPGYRWCGPGCSGPGTPLNEVDSCCKTHDECYRAYGGPDCRCDSEFLRCLERQVTPNSRQGRDALRMYRFMRMWMSFNC